MKPRIKKLGVVWGCAVVGGMWCCGLSPARAYAVWLELGDKFEWLAA